MSVLQLFLLTVSHSWNDNHTFSHINWFLKGHCLKSIYIRFFWRSSKNEFELKHKPIWFRVQLKPHYNKNEFLVCVLWTENMKEAINRIFRKILLLCTMYCHNGALIWRKHQNSLYCLSVSHTLVSDQFIFVFIF